jgi:mRNA-degrading endonuclease toxin of MazEF toxin-antitoxin module
VKLAAPLVGIGAVEVDIAASWSGTTVTVRLPCILPAGVTSVCFTGWTGYANADCIEQIGKDELRDYLGVLTPATMRLVNQALTVALAL